MHSNRAPRMPSRIVLFAALTAALLGASAARAASCGDDEGGFQNWLAGFRQQAARAGISPEVIQSSLADVEYDESVISHDRGQRAFHESFEQFSRKKVSAYRIKKGRSLLEHYSGMFRTIEARYGVPGPVLVAIWGLETEFGAGSGDYPTFSALATLAYDCRRSEEFHAELLDALRLVQRGDLDGAQTRGAWAGEIGQTQFMPSSYLKYGVGLNGGAGDIIHSSGDALASTANFLHDKGWQRGAGWDAGQPNFAALMEWNKAEVYCRTIAALADRIAGAGGPAAQDDQQQ
jgi:lytic murein transglycosylase